MYYMRQLNGEQVMQDTIDIRTIYKVLMRKIVWIVAAVIFGLILMLFISKFVMTPMYTANVQLYVSTEETNSNPNKSTIEFYRSLVSTYIVLLESRDSLHLVASELSTNVSTSQIKKYINMSSVNNTEVLKIEATTPDPVLSAEICTALAKHAPTVIENSIKGGYVKVVDKAVVPTEPSSPNVTMYSALGAILGFVLSCGIILLVHFLDNTVKGADDVSERFGLPILGEIPNLFIGQKGGYGYATKEEN